MTVNARKYLVRAGFAASHQDSTYFSHWLAKSDLPSGVLRSCHCRSVKPDLLASHTPNSPAVQ